MEQLAGQDWAAHWAALDDVMYESCLLDHTEDERNIFSPAGTTAPCPVSPLENKQQLLLLSEKSDVAAH